MPEVLNTRLDQARTGCPWDLRPHDLLPKSTVGDDFQPGRDDGTWQSTARRSRARKSAA